MSFFKKTADLGEHRRWGVSYDKSRTSLCRLQGDKLAATRKRHSLKRAKVIKILYWVQRWKNGETAEISRDPVISTLMQRLGAANFPIMYHYLNTAQISSSSHNPFLSLEFFLHLHGFKTTPGVCLPFVWSVTVKALRERTTTCALSLNLQNSSILWKSEIIFLPYKWENVPDTRWWSP